MRDYLEVYLKEKLTNFFFDEANKKFDKLYPNGTDKERLNYHYHQDRSLLKSIAELAKDYNEMQEK